jgi:tetratricopeptide (TPR) repeat protein
MKPIALLPLCLLVSLAGGYLGARLLPAPASLSAAETAAAEPKAAAPAAPRDEAQEQRLEGLETRLSMIEQRLEGLQRAPLAVAETVPPSASQGGAPAPLASDAPTDPAAQVDSWFAALTAGDLDFDGREALWQKIREAKQTDAVIALFEARAKADPSNPDLQTELGEAYLAKIQEVAGGPLAGVWAGKADKAFDSALALDDHHVQARFMKAMSLSFWPPVFGKQAQAVKQFEILIGQQQNSAPSDWQSQAYLMLGNLHLQMGKPEQAKLTYQQGLAIYPEHADLLKQMGLLE